MVDCRDCGSLTEPRKSGAKRCSPCEVRRVERWRAENVESLRAQRIRYKAKKAGRPFEPAPVRTRMSDEEARERKNAQRRVNRPYKKTGPKPDPNRLFTKSTGKKRALGTPGAHRVRDREALFRRYGGKCAYCSEPAVEMDHVIPLSRGGSDWIGNLLPCCERCNSSKNKRTVMEWRLGKWPVAV